jgi:hypothetical protein
MEVTKETVIRYKDVQGNSFDTEAEALQSNEDMCLESILDHRIIYEDEHNDDTIGLSKWLYDNIEYLQFLLNQEHARRAGIDKIKIIWTNVK